MTEKDSIEQRIEDIETHIGNARGLAGEDTPLMITLSSTLAQLHQAQAQARIADAAEEITAHVSGFIALLDGPVGSKLWDLMGLGEDESGDEDEDEPEDEPEDD